MKPRRGSVVRFVSATLLALSLSGATAPSTDAATGSCSGRLIVDLPAVNRETKEVVGELVVYYSTANGGTNCARFNHLGSSYGHSWLTYVELVACKETKPGVRCATDKTVRDFAYYSFYAGPVRLTNMAHRCLTAEGDMLELHALAETGANTSHCSG